MSRYATQLDYPHRNFDVTLSPVKLQDDDLRQFSQIWLEEFHETLSMEEARFCASMLLELYSVLVRQFPSDSPVAKHSAAQHRT